MKKLNLIYTFVLLIALIIPPVTIAVTDADIQNSLLFWWNLVNTTGNISGSIIIDQAGLNNGTLSGTTCTASYCNLSNTAHIDLNTPLNLTGNNTLYVVMKSTLNSSDRYLLTYDDSGNNFALGQFPTNGRLASYMGGVASTYSQVTLSDTKGVNRIAVLHSVKSYWYFNNATNISDPSKTYASDTNYLGVTRVGTSGAGKTQPGTYYIIFISNKTLSQDELDYLQTKDNYYNPFAGGEAPAGSSPIDFISQEPADIKNLNLFGTRLNITFNVTNQTSLTRVYLNYSFTGNGCVFAINKSCITEYNTAYQRENDTSSVSFQNFLIGDNQIYPATYNINETQLENTSHNFTALTSTNEYILITLNNVTIKKYGVFEIMSNTTGTSKIIYCNESFDLTNPAINPNCIQFGTLNRTDFNHSHPITGNNSRHNIFNFPINTTSSRIGSVGITSKSYFLIEGTSTGTTYVYNVPLTSGRSYYKISSNSGSTWTNLTSLTIDSHLHQYNGTETYNYQGCTNKSGTVACSTTRSDNLDVTILPPTSPSITNPSIDAQNGTNNFNLTWTSSIPFNTSFTISGYNVSLLNNDTTLNLTLIGNSTSNNYYFDLYNLNLSIGSYRFKVVATDSGGLTSFDISRYINLNNNAIINLTIKSGINNQTISNYTVNITDTITGITSTYYSNTSTNKTRIEIIKDRVYNITIDAPNYAIQSFNTRSYPLTYNEETLTIYTSNSVRITIYDESTLQIINTTTVSITFQNNITAVGYTTSNGTFYKDNLQDGTWEIKFYSTNYSYRTYTITVGNRSTQTLDAYLVPSTYLCVFTIRDALTLATLEGTSFTVERQTNGTYIIVESKTADISGAVQIGFLPGIEYRFTLSKTGYSTKVFSLNPIIFNAYNIYLDRTVNLNNTLNYGLVTIVYYPKQFFNNRINNLTFIITSPEGVLTNYKIGINTVPGSNGTSGSNAIGETFNLGFNISNATLYDRVNITFNFTSTTGGFQKFFLQYEIIGAGTVSNYTISNLRNKDYGLGTFEKVLMVMIATAILSGFAFMLLGAGGSLIIGLLTLNISVYLGFLPLWSVIIPDLIGFVLIIAVSIGGRN